MNMKTLDVEQLSRVAGAEPRGVNTAGRQNDGSDIWGSGAARIKNEGQIVVTVLYTDGDFRQYPNVPRHNPKAP
jgi:hypothetical protein